MALCEVFTSFSSSSPTRQEISAQLSPHLKWDDNHENFFVFIWQDVFNESPACANEGDSDEQKSSLQSGRQTDTAVRDLILFYHTSSSAQVSPTANKATNPNKCFPIHNFGKHLSIPQQWSRCTCYNCVSQSNIRPHSQYMQSFPGGVIHAPLWTAANTGSCTHLPFTPGAN